MQRSALVSPSNIRNMIHDKRDANDQQYDRQEWPTDDTWEVNDPPYNREEWPPK